MEQRDKYPTLIKQLGKEVTLVYSVFFNNGEMEHSTIRGTLLEVIGSYLYEGAQTECLLTLDVLKTPLSTKFWKILPEISIDD